MVPSISVAMELPNPVIRAQSIVDLTISGHVNVLFDYKETGPENIFISSKKHISGSLKMHACVLPLNIYQTEHALLHQEV